MSRRSQIEQMLADDPDDLFLQYALAMACVTEGDAAAALAGFDRVLCLNADYVPAYFQKAQLLAREGQTDEAVSLLKTGIAVAQRTGDTHAAGEMAGFLETLQ